LADLSALSEFPFPFPFPFPLFEFGLLLFPPALLKPLMKNNEKIIKMIIRHLFMVILIFFASKIYK
jgi:hypothetical protein